METIDVQELKIKSKIYFCSFSEIYTCDLGKEKYILKRFYDPEHVFTPCYKRKLDILYQDDLQLSVVPQYLVIDGNHIIGYITERVKPNNIFSAISSKKVFFSLKRVRDSIGELHRHSIIHGDVHFGNILVKEKKEVLGDFDNCEIIDSGFSELDYFRCSKPVREFILRNGVVSNIDIFMHNLLTFYKLNNLYDEYDTPAGLYGLKTQVVKAISRKNYGLFESSESRKICDDLVNLRANEFLIDSIDADEVKSYRLNL